MVILRRAVLQDFPQKFSLVIQVTRMRTPQCKGNCGEDQYMSVWEVLSPQHNRPCWKHGRCRYIVQSPDPPASPVTKDLPAACLGPNRHGAGVVIPADEHIVVAEKNHRRFFIPVSKISKTPVLLLTGNISKDIFLTKCIIHLIIKERSSGL